MMRSTADDIVNALIAAFCGLCIGFAAGTLHQTRVDAARCASLIQALCVQPEQPADPPDYSGGASGEL
jgi:hypothetical protein